MKFVLIRHSKTLLDKEVANEQWILSEEGICLAQELSKLPIIKKCNVIYSSLQTKALETALLIAKPNHIAIKTNANLTETTSVTNGFFDNFETEISKWHEGDYQINNGETKAESLNRFKNALEEIALKERDSEYVGIVAHGNVLAIFSELYSDKSSYEIHQNIKMPDVALLDADNWQFINFWGSLN